MLVSDLIPPEKDASKTMKKARKPLKLAKSFEPYPVYQFEERVDSPAQNVEPLEKLSLIIEAQPVLPQEPINPVQSQTKLAKIIEQQEENEETRKLNFRNEDVSYLFTLLLNETKSKIKELKDSYKDEQEYLAYLIPPFINETLAYVKSVAEDQFKKYKSPNVPLPLRYLVQIDRKHTILGKLLVLNAVEGDFDQERAYTWKHACITEFYEYTASRCNVVQVIVRQIGSHDQKAGLLGIILKQENKSNLIYLPWSSRVINALKIPNLVAQHPNIDLSQEHNLLKQRYFPLTYPNFDELFPHQFLVHVIPIYQPSTYLIEMKAILLISKSPFFKFILNPKVATELQPVSKKAWEFGAPLSQICAKQLSNQQKYNQSQAQAIQHATNYAQPFTIINGPPGTGKTYTSLGIMKVVMERMDQLNDHSVILACGHSNTVINDWVRKLVTQTDADEKAQKRPKVMRVGVPDKCDSDIYDYCLEVVSQRKFFLEYAPEYEKKSVCEMIPAPRKYDQLTLVHIKQKIQSLNDKIYDYQDMYESLDDYRRGWVDAELQTLQAQKKELRKIYANLVQILGIRKKEYKKIMLQALFDAKIIVSTLTSSASSTLEMFLEDKYISMLIVDEAPMCFEPSVLIPLSRHQILKLVLLGDHKQLGPVIYDTTNTTDFGYHVSLYERILNATSQYIQLNIQYRSMPNLSWVTSHYFYEGKVQDDKTVQAMDFPDYLRNKLSKNQNFMFFDVHMGAQLFNENKNSFYNEHEALGVYFLVSHLLSEYEGNEKPISIITPYRAQVKYIKELFFKFGHKFFNKVEVDTIDAFQGKENDIMVISLVRSEGLGFLSDLRRANVATSRAQYGQFLFGNAAALALSGSIGYHAAGLFWAHLAQYLRQNQLIVQYGEEEISSQVEFFEETLN